MDKCQEIYTQYKNGEISKETAMLLYYQYLDELKKNYKPGSE